MNTQGIDQLLSDLSAASAKAAGKDTSTAAGAADFAALLKSSIDQVSGTQTDAMRLQQEFDRDGSGADLQEVMVSLQKANLSFQTMVQVRNRLVSAYQEIMNMSV